MRKTATVFCSLLLTFALPGHSAGELYKCKGENGETVFSDQPCPGGETLPMRETPTYAPPPTPALPRATDAEEKEKAVQYVVEIVEPAADAVLRDNEGRVSVSASVKPALGPALQARLLLDGSPTGDVDGGTSWQLENVERGEHSVVVEIIHGRSDKVLARSASRAFVLFRASANQNPNGAGNLQLKETNSGYVQQVQWPQLQDARQPGDPVPTTPTKPVTNGPRK